MNAPRAARLIALAVTLMIGNAACSSGGTRDQYYGTDVGVNWIPADATPRDAPVDASAPDAAGRDAGASAADVTPSAEAPSGDTITD
jgi:hypothetical protein